MDMVKALKQAYQLGQDYWDQADSDYRSDHRKAEVTQAAFHALLGQVAIDEGKRNATLEDIGSTADTVDNLIGAFQIPMAPELHKKHMTANLIDTRDRLRRVYVSITGENPWETHPL